ncbi:N-acetylmuramoyl-L-alanine amidase [Promicromonospora sp. MEB111]|uniref:N-acetylmuramoyl-L-alanine amidase n=1 Tax=Promicromonospora sp. MEB111 TaxID=3040301 RepID=UPI00254A8F68|nr:N-acetylmuramoyl-L-alanine amidase [Promicromonospora sp. MEB111]
MVRHAAAPASRSKQGPRHSAGKPALAGTAVGRTIILGVAPAMVLGGALAPAATALTAEPSLEPEGIAAPADSALPDAGTTEAQVETVEVAAAPAEETAVVDDVTGADPEAAAGTATAADGAVVLDTADTDGRIAGAIEVPDGFQTVGLSWPAEIDHVVPEMQVRTRATDGTWSGWSHLEKSTDGADGGSAVVTSAPVYVGEADAVQLATVDEAAEFPAGVELSLVSSAQVTTAAATTSGTVAPSATTAGPTIITREEWGAAPRCLEPGTGPTWFPAEGGLKAAAVHHTVNPNDYATVAEAMQAIRNDQAYHQQTHGWCDIGYNFLVDKWGNIYEGADGSIEEPIIGAHTGGFNTGTVGVAMIGTYTTAAGVKPTTAQRDGVAKIIGSRLAQYDVNPDETTVLTAAGHTDGGRYYAGDQVTLPRVFGHRDTHQTECPGELAYPLLSGIQDQAAVYAKQYAEVDEQSKNFVQAMYQDYLGRAATATDIESWSYRVSVDGPGVLADGMAKSDNYRKVRISQAFQATLGYTPSATQTANYLAMVKKKTRTIDQIEPYLMGTSTYYKHVGGTDAKYVTALYQHILHRPPTSDQLKHWMPRLNTLGRAGVVNALWKNPQAVRYRVVATYQHYLGVAPTTAQADTWVKRLTTAGTTEDEATLRRAIVVTTKYLAAADARY